MNNSAALDGAAVDPAPWWIREIRVYGVSGIVALVACYGLRTVYQNSRDDLRERDVKQEIVMDKFVSMNTQTVVALDRNSGAFENFATALQQFNAARLTPKQNP